MRARNGFVVVLMGAMLTASPAVADISRSICCEGEYNGHLQGVATDGKALYWSFTVALVKTDFNGRVLVRRDVPEHHGDLCVKDGIVYVAVNYGAFNCRTGAVSRVIAYSGDTLDHRREWKVDELVYGAGGIATRGGRFFVVGGLPANCETNYVYEYASDLSFVCRHELATGNTVMGIQTAHAAADGRILLGFGGWPGNPGGVFACDGELKGFERHPEHGAISGYAVLELGGVLYAGCSWQVKGKKTWRGRIEAKCGCPQTLFRVFYEGRDTTGWKDCGYELPEDGWRSLVTVGSAFSHSTNTVLAAVGIGNGRRYSLPDLQRGLRQAAATGRILALHVPGTPESVKADKRLVETLLVLEAEARQLGIAE